MRSIDQIRDVSDDYLIEEESRKIGEYNGKLESSLEKILPDIRSIQARQIQAYRNPEADLEENEDCMQKV